MDPLTRKLIRALEKRIDETYPDESSRTPGGEIQVIRLRCCVNCKARKRYSVKKTLVKIISFILILAMIYFVYSR
jgi:hypothetical protein